MDTRRRTAATCLYRHARGGPETTRLFHRCRRDELSFGTRLVADSIFVLTENKARLDGVSGVGDSLSHSLPNERVKPESREPGADSRRYKGSYEAEVIYDSPRSQEPLSLIHI